jgi:uncharacterized membrane protein
MPDGRKTGMGAGAAASAPDPFARTDAPVLALTLWPNRSFSRRGWTVVLALLAAGLAVPLLPLVGTAAAWGMLPFLVGALVALYLAVRRSHLDARLTEELKLWPDLITVVRREPSGAVRRWHANPFWVRLRLREDAHVEKYLTLVGSGREIELGAFLSPGEREALHAELAAALARLRGPQQSR